MLGPNINPATQDYTLVNGNIVNANALLSLSYMRLKCPYGSYFYDSNFGNKLLSQPLALAQINRRTVSDMVYEALADMVTLGYITDLVVVCTYLSFQDAKFDIIMKDNFGDTLTFTWDVNLG